jgi:hypothetical protein
MSEPLTEERLTEIRDTPMRPEDARIASELLADNDRLRAALRRIACTPDGACNAEYIARKALGISVDAPPTPA